MNSRISPDPGRGINDNPVLGSGGSKHCSARHSTAQKSEIRNLKRRFTLAPSSFFIPTLFY
jgi:hypothetical protein